MIDAIDHVVLTSSNLENTLNFYCKVLEMKLKKELIKEVGSIRHSLHFGNNKINIHELNNIWESKLIKFNIKIIEGPVNRIGATSNLLSIYCNDPDGNLIEISNVIQEK